MKTMTIRGFDPELAEKIRRTAEKEKKSHENTERGNN